ncbi:MAG: hypothetical protein NVS3B20_24200 [Polyangiales bacterium]
MNVVSASPSPSKFRGTIDPPPRVDGRGVAIIVIVVATFAISGPLPSSATFPILAVLATSTALALFIRCPHAVHAGLFGVLYLGVLHAPKIGRMWPLPMVIILALYAAIVSSSRWLRKSMGWLRFGTIDRVARIMIAVSVVASAISLITWRLFTSVDLTQHRSFVPTQVPFWTLPIGLLAWASLNAAFEEIMWRGVIMSALEAAFGPGYVAWLLQGIGFGVWHFGGFPSGVIGSGLATVFALMMGALRMRGRGMLAPLIAHTLADTTIFILVLAMVVAK